MKAEELETIMDAVHNALEVVRCLGALKTRGAMFLIPKNDMEAYLGGNLEGKLVDAAGSIQGEKQPDSARMQHGIYIGRKRPERLTLWPFRVIDRLPKKKGADADAYTESCDICQGFNRA